MTTLDALIAYCIERINADFSMHYERAEDVFTIVSGEDGSWAQRNDALDDRIGEMYDAADIEDSLGRAYLASTRMKTTLSTRG